MRRLLQALVGQERAIANARTACTSLSQRRVEREDVELFLEAPPPGSRRRRAVRLTVLAGRDARPSTTGRRQPPYSLHPVSPDPAAPARRVVIAEDEALIRLDLAEMLAEEGYDVVGQAGDGRRPSSSPGAAPPDLVVLDVKMPKLDGIAAAERIAEQRIAPVVILTAFSQRDLVDRARDAGAMAYLVKPFNKTDLVPAIEMAVSRFAELQHARGRGRRPGRAAGDPQGGRPRQGRAAAASSSLSEPDAFRWIQKTAMDLRLSMRQVAEGVITHGPSVTGATAPRVEQRRAARNGPLVGVKVPQVTKWQRQHHQFVLRSPWDKDFGASSLHQNARSVPGGGTPRTLLMTEDQ